MKSIDLQLDDATAALLLHMTGRNGQSKLVGQLIRQEAQRREGQRLVELEAEAAQLRAKLAQTQDSRHER